MDPTTRIAARRRFIAERTAELQAELETLVVEARDLDITERTLKRFSDAPSPATTTPIVAAVVNDANDQDPQEELTLPRMVFTILEEAKAAGRKWVPGSEILELIQKRWRPDFTPDQVRPTLWRMARKEGRLKKRGKTYSLPVSSPEGETGALGAPARH